MTPIYPSGADQQAGSPLVPMRSDPGTYAVPSTVSIQRDSDAAGLQAALETLERACLRAHEAGEKLVGQLGAVLQDGAIADWVPQPSSVGASPAASAVLYSADRLFALANWLEANAERIRH